MELFDGEFLGVIKALGVQGISVYRNGKVGATHHFVSEERRNQYSASKSFTSVAIGMGIGEGLFSLDDRILDRLGEYAPEKYDANLEKTTVRDCLMMACGHGDSYLMMGQRDALRDVNWCTFSMSQPFPNVPGTKMVYDNSSTYMAGVVLQKCAGENLVDYLTPRLFDPLGIPRPEWETSPEGYTLGSSTLTINVSELLRFGIMLLHDGVYDGRRIVSKEWIDEASSVQITGDGAGKYGYGYQFWRGAHDSFRADGAYGQFCIVYRDREAVVAINSHSEVQGKILDAVDEMLYGKL